MKGQKETETGQNGGAGIASNPNMDKTLRVAPSGATKEKEVCKTMESIKLCIHCNQAPQLIGSWCSKLCRSAYYKAYSDRRTRKRREEIASTDVACKGCGETFRCKKSFREKYCSKKCQQDSLNKRLRVTSMALHHFTCGWCQQKGVSKSKAARFCSKGCSDSAYKLRKSNWKPSKVSNCAWCGFGFLGDGDFCSSQCEGRSQMIIAGIRLIKKLASRINVWLGCAECGTTVKSVAGKKYCSKRCSKKARRRTDGYKAKKAKWRKSWKKRNPAKAREQKKACKHRRRARLKNNGIEDTSDYRARMTHPLVRQVCFYCGVDCTGAFHWDHRIPIAAGGPEAEWNLVIACPPCNLKKGAKVPKTLFAEEIFKEP